MSGYIQNIKIPDSVTNTVNNVKASVSNAYNNVAGKTAELATSVKSSLQDFSSKSMVDGNSDFLQSNTIVAKFAFVILVLIVFLFLCNLGIMLIGYFTSPPTSPYLLSGTASGSSEVTIPQDPKNKSSVQVLRSSNGDTGIEFTWSVWLFLTNIDMNNNSNYRHIFNKGNKPTRLDPSGIASVNNGPGLYAIIDTSSNEATLRVVMNTVDFTNVHQHIDVKEVPLLKWFNCVIRLENKILDVYINGTISQRLILDDVPRQNYYDVNICSNGGFSGNIADLHYFNRALSVFEINNIVVWGRNTNASNAGGVNGAVDATGFPYYLSSSWYTS